MLTAESIDAMTRAIEGPRVQPEPWHALEVDAALAALDSDAEHGLSGAEAERRLATAGENRIAPAPDTPLWRLVVRQFESLVVLLLLAAAVIAALLGETAEAIAILAALVLNALIGFATEWRARISLARLRDLAVPSAVVRRDGRVVEIPAARLVPGDVIVLEAGAHVPADARLVRCAALRVTEAALTGESEPVDKDARATLDPEVPLPDRSTMVYMGTATVAGSALAVVTGTGEASELGHIGRLIEGAGERTTPLERQVEHLGRRLMLLALGAGVVVAVAGILRGQPWGLMFETAITLAVAAIPEGLPAIVTVALAVGVWRLARAGALVRRLPAVETLGSTTVICADKTGTMTENRMTVVRLVVGDRTVQVVTGPEPGFVEDGHVVDPRRDPALVRLLTVAALVNDANAERREEGLTTRGDPTETALLVAALHAGLDPGALARQWPRLAEIPFSPDTRVMGTFHRTPGGDRAWLAKGAPAALLQRCPMSDGDRARLLDTNRALARDGLRVLAVGWRPDGAGPDDGLDGLTFLGFIALADPIRPGVAEAIARCGAAGVRTVMLTGDQRATAEAVGAALGLAAADIRSRVSPEAKLDLVRALQAEGEIVAMTGDGVNDAPALARADIGVAMGRHGTDVARDAADVVLTDDDFATITRAVEEGRVIYANLRKVLHFLFSCNVSEIVAILVAIAAGFPSPLLPLQILWVNLVTDILPAVALIRDPADPDVMRRRPRDPRAMLVTWRFGGAVVLEGVLLAAGVLSAYFWTVASSGAGPRASTVAFVALVLVHPLQALYCRSDVAGWWRLAPNPLVWASLVVLVAVQWCATAWSPLAGVLGTVALVPADWIVVVAGITWPIVVLEAIKGVRKS